MESQNTFAIVNEKQIYYEFLNQKFFNNKTPVLIFLHEGLGSCAQWNKFPNELSNKLQLPALVYDRYGYGKSEARPRKRPASYMEDEAFIFLPELLKELQINNPLILIGHSDGGTIALLFASKFTDKVKCIITEADHVFCDETTINGIKKARKEYEKGLLKKVLYRYHKEKTDSVFYGWNDVWISEYAISWNIQSFLKIIICPTLIIQGGQDQFGAYNQIELKLQNIQGKTEVLFLENCGHVPHIQEKEIVLNKTSEFIINNLPA